MWVTFPGWATSAVCYRGTWPDTSNLHTIGRRYSRTEGCCHNIQEAATFFLKDRLLTWFSLVPGPGPLHDPETEAEAEADAEAEVEMDAAEAMESEEGPAPFRKAVALKSEGRPEALLRPLFRLQIRAEELQLLAELSAIATRPAVLPLQYITNHKCWQ